jgi:hypothetical protein
MDEKEDYAAEQTPLETVEPTVRMKPKRMQYFFAKSWPVTISFIGFIFFVVYLIVRACGPSALLLADWRYLLWFIGVILLTLPLSLLLSLILLGLVIGPLYHHRGLKNGAPFYVGDRVRILSGRHLDKISRIYSTWQRGTFRVEIGQKEKDEFKDIFGPSDLFREVQDEQNRKETSSEHNLG